MEQIIYSFEVVDVIEDRKVMYVRFDREGYQSHIVGCPIPHAGVELPEYLRTYAPLGLWKDEDTPREAVRIGVKGTIQDEA